MTKNNWFYKVFGDLGADNDQNQLILYFFAGLGANYCQKQYGFIKFLVVLVPTMTNNWFYNVVGGFGANNDQKQLIIYKVFGGFGKQWSKAIDFIKLLVWMLTMIKIIWFCKVFGVSFTNDDQKTFDFTSFFCASGANNYQKQFGFIKCFVVGWQTTIKNDWSYKVFDDVVVNSDQKQLILYSFWWCGGQQ